MAGASFQNHFGFSPFNITCSCCGNDYVVYENESIEDLIDLDSVYGVKYSSIEEYLKKERGLVLS